MAELRTLVEREMDRAGSPSYSFVDLARHRDRKQRNRRLATAALALALAAAAIGGAIRAFDSEPVPADETTPSPFVGTWELFAHGSLHTLEIRDVGDGTYEMELFDAAATVCDGTPATVTGVGTLAGSSEMTVISQVITCEDGTVLTDVPPATYAYDPETDTLFDSSGEVWHRLGSDSTAVPWRGIWPQDTREEAERAQRRADAGDPDFTWQVGIDPANAEGDDVGAPIATRFVASELGWDHYRTVAGGGGSGKWDLVFIRCKPAASNPLYPNDPEGGDCAPTIDRFHYETAKVTIEQLVRTDRSGIWIVTGWRELPDSDEPVHDGDWHSRQYEQTVPPTRAELRGFLEAFLEARVADEGVEEFLAPSTSEIPLLYASSEGKPFVRSEIARVQWGPQWPDGTSLVTLRLFTAGGGMVEEDFYVWPDEEGRLRLLYPFGGTTENGADVLEPYGILGGRVTFKAPDSWFSPWTLGVVESDESILVGGGPEGTNFVVIEVRAPEPPCASSGSPASAEELAARILGDPELEATVLEPVTIGGVEALRLDVVPAAGARICDDEQFGRGMPVVMHADGSHAWAVDRGERMRVHLLDLPGESGRTLAILIVSPEESFEDVLTAAAPILDSFEFGPA